MLSSFFTNWIALDSSLPSTKNELNLIKKDDPRLKESCVEVKDFQNKEFYRDLVNQITEASIEQYAFAAAAPQFGINKRFIVMISATEKKVKSKEELEEFHDNFSKIYDISIWLVFMCYSK